MWRVRSHAATLPELLVACALFALVLSTVVSLQLSGHRLFGRLDSLDQDYRQVMLAERLLRPLVEGGKVSLPLLGDRSPRLDLLVPERDSANQLVLLASGVPLLRAVPVAVESGGMLTANGRVLARLGVDGSAEFSWVKPRLLRVALYSVSAPRTSGYRQTFDIFVVNQLR